MQIRSQKTVIIQSKDGEKKPNTSLSLTDLHEKPGKPPKFTPTPPEKSPKKSMFSLRLVRVTHVSG